MYILFEIFVCLIAIYVGIYAAVHIVASLCEVVGSIGILRRYIVRCAKDLSERREKNKDKYIMLLDSLYVIDKSRGVLK